MKQSHFLIRGTIILTFAGVLCKVLGCVMRIFLSRYLGAEGVGIVQLVSPLHILGIIIASYGFQTAISRFVSATPNDCPQERFRILKAGLVLALSIAFFYSLILFLFCKPLALFLLREESSASLLKLVAICTPLETLHICINGYYYGRKKTAVPAISQLLEQTFRVLAIWLLFSITCSKAIPFKPFHAILGNIIGDIASILFSLTSLALERSGFTQVTRSILPYRRIFSRLTSVALPLTVSQTITSVFQSVETVLIPSMLQCFGYNKSTALSMYGILTGMALPIIMFPATLTNSFALLLLPAISEASAKNNNKDIRSITQKTIHLCLLIGIFSTCFLLFLGDFIGNFLFQNSLAGAYISTLGFLCPFLFLNMTLSSILNGLGKTKVVFRSNLTGLSIRIFFTLFFIPRIGIYGYFFGFLFSALVMSALLFFSVRTYVFPRYLKNEEAPTIR